VSEETSDKRFNRCRGKEKRTATSSDVEKRTLADIGHTNDTDLQVVRGTTEEGLLLGDGSLCKEGRRSASGRRKGKCWGTTSGSCDRSDQLSATIRSLRHPLYYHSSRPLVVSTFRGPPPLPPLQVVPSPDEAL
jgi:hypothetical protein